MSLFVHTAKRHIQLMRTFGSCSEKVQRIIKNQMFLQIREMTRWTSISEKCSLAILVLNFLFQGGQVIHRIILLLFIKCNRTIISLSNMVFYVVLVLAEELTGELLSKLLNHNGRTLDQLKIETRQLTDNEVITQIENHYFDIIECK